MAGLFKGVAFASSKHRAASGEAHPGEKELRVCTHRTCRKQGAQQILQFTHDLSLGRIHVAEAGCLGNCGNGPNVALLPSGERLSHISTPAHVAKMLSVFCGVEVDEALLKATELRLAGNLSAKSGNLQRAIQLYTQALELRPPYGSHMLMSNRSGAKLAAGDAEGALEDALAAVELGPANFTTACVRQVEALLRLGRHSAAMQSLLMQVERLPEFAASGEYHMLVEHINTAVAEAEAASQAAAGAVAEAANQAVEA